MMRMLAGLALTLMLAPTAAAHHYEGHEPVGNECDSTVDYSCNHYDHFCSGSNPGGEPGSGAGVPPGQGPICEYHKVGPTCDFYVASRCVALQPIVDALPLYIRLG